jgi:hypothetical protein
MRAMQALGLGLIFINLAACTGDEPKRLQGEALKDPESCRSCHESHVEQWSGSMHAYAGEDPLFLAMNAAGQRETNGALGDFCVKCHAPVALMSGATKDGTNLPDLPAYLRGVTCYFCHSVESVEGTHNNPLRLADDGVLRGGVRDPVDNPAHASAYSPFHDRNRRESSDLCGSCHDIVSPSGSHIERTFAEWKASQFGNGESALVSCGNCHMPGTKGPIADFDGVKLRQVHEHEWPGVDVALTPFPKMAEQRAAVEKALSQTVIAQLCVSPPLASLGVDVVLENAFAGHAFPSGATPDRRAWVELVAYKGDAVVFESGIAKPGEAIADLPDPNLLLFRDRIFDANGKETHGFWHAASYESKLLMPRPAPDHRFTHRYAVPLAKGLADRVTMRLRIQPIGLDVLAPLVKSGDLEQSIVDAMPTFEVAAAEWRAADGYGCVPEDAFTR